MDVEQQKAQIARLDVELNRNLAVADQLRKNTILMLNNFETLSHVVRTPNIKILDILFPEKNLDLKIPDDRTTGYADDAMDQLGSSGLLNDQLEREKETAAANALTATIQATLGTVRSLQDPNQVRYTFYDSVWQQDQASIEKVVVADLTPHQTSYGKLELLRANYDVVAQHFVEYLLAFQDFFDPTKHLITRDSLRQILTTERYTDTLLTTYCQELATEMAGIKALSAGLRSQPQPA